MIGKIETGSDRLSSKWKPVSTLNYAKFNW